MTAQEIKTQYEAFEARYGADAPVALLRWLQCAPRDQMHGVPELVALLKEKLAERAVRVFCAANVADSDENEIEAYESTAKQISRSLRVAALNSAWGE